MLEELYEQAKLGRVNPQVYCNALQKLYPARELERLLYDPDGRHKKRFRCDKDYDKCITDSLMFLPATNDLGYERKQCIICTKNSFAGLSEAKFRIIYLFHELQHVRDNFHGLCLPNGRIITQKEMDSTPLLVATVHHIMEIRALNNELKAYKGLKYKDDIKYIKKEIGKEISKLRRLFKLTVGLRRDDLRVLAAKEYLGYK